jgi:hypothetical protein
VGSGRVVQDDHGAAHTDGQERRGEVGLTLFFDQADRGLANGRGRTIEVDHARVDLAIVDEVDAAVASIGVVSSVRVETDPGRGQEFDAAVYRRHSGAR